MYDAAKIAAQNKSKYIRLNVMVRDDINWCEKFAAVFNSKAAIQNEWFQFPIVSDSSRKGFAAYAGDDWIAGTWDNSMVVDSSCVHIVPPPLIDCFDVTNINVLELWPVVKALQRWCVIMKNKKVECKTDNMQVFYMLKTGRSKNVSCMSWLREIFWICM